MKRNCTSNHCFLLILAFVICLLPSPGIADIFTWKPAITDGAFEDADNWTPAGGPPTDVDIAQFNTAATNHITFNMDRTNSRLEVATGYNNGTEIQFNLGGYTYSMTNEGSLMSAALRLGDREPSALIVSNGIFDTAGFVLGRAGGDGILTITGAGTTWRSTNDITNARDVNAGSEIKVLNGAITDLRSVIIAAGGKLTVEGTSTTWSNTSLTVGGEAFFNNTTSYTARLISGTDGVITVSNATLNRYSVTAWTQTYGWLHLMDNAEYFDNGESSMRIGHVTTGSGGATVRSGSIMTLIVQPALYGLLGISGSGSRVEAQGLGIYIHGGTDYAGIMQVDDGAVADISGAIEIGRTTGRTGIVEVAASDSVVNAGSIYVGGFSSGSVGTGILTVKNGGRASASNSVFRVWDTGTLNIDGGTLIAARVQMENAGAHVNVTLQTGGTNALVTSQAVGTGSANRGDAQLFGAEFNLALAERFSSYVGEEFTIIRIEGTRTGEFNNLPDGTIISIKEDRWLSAFEFQVDYNGGISGKDVVLRTIAVPAAGTMFRFR